MNAMTILKLLFRILVCYIPLAGVIGILMAVFHYAISGHLLLAIILAFVGLFVSSLFEIAVRP